MKIKLISLLLTALLLFSCTACSAKDSDYIKGKGTVVVGVTDYMPMNYLDSKGNWVGFDTEFAKLVFHNLGLEVKFETVFWDEKADDLNSKKIDCIWNGYTVNDIDDVEFTKPYAKNSQVFVTTFENKDLYTDVSKITDINVAVEKGSASERVIKTLGLNVKPVYCDTQKDALIALSEGRAEGCVVDKMIYNSLVHTDLACCVILNVEEFAIGFRKRSDMVEIVNDEIDKLIDSGELDALADKYEIELIK